MKNGQTQFKLCVCSGHLEIHVKSDYPKIVFFELLY